MKETLLPWRYGELGCFVLISWLPFVTQRGIGQGHVKPNYAAT